MLASDVRFLFHLNIRSLENKVEELEIFLDSLDKQVDLICLTETWLKDGQENTVILSGFKLASNYGRSVKRGGGACIYIREGDSIKFRPRSVKSVEGVFEACAIDILEEPSYTVVVIYRPPHHGNLKDFLSEFESQLGRIKKANRHVIVCGDLNINLLVHTERAQIEEVTMSLGLLILDFGATRTTANTRSALDVVISNWKDVVFASHIDPGLSDHSGQLVTIPLPANKEMKLQKSQVPFMKRRFPKEEVQSFIYDLGAENWTATINGSSVEEKYDAFLHSFLLLFEKHFPNKPVVKQRGNLSKGWVTLVIRQMCKLKRHLSHLLKTGGSPAIGLHLKELSKNLRAEIKKEKQLYHANLIMKADNKQTASWKLVKTLTGREKKETKPITLIKNGKMITDQLEVANMFNNYFLSVGSDTKSPLPTSPDTNYDKSLYYLKSAWPDCASVLQHTTVTAEDILNTIDSFKPKISSGWDEVPMSLIKQVGASIAVPLAHVANVSFLTGKFPSKMKLSIVKPIHKKNVTSDCSNYRPIALITSFAKIFEKIMQLKLMNHLSSSNMVSEDQHGFRKGHSTMTAVFNMIHTVTEALEEKNKVGAVLCDLSKAFDVMDHELLLKKLKWYGFSGITEKWIESYLTNREQRVRLSQQAESPYKLVQCGVPQGSILGPLLFSILVNDLSPSTTLNKPNRKIVQYADDSSAVVEARNSPDLDVELTATIHVLGDWFESNKLRLNHEKTEVIIFSSRGKSLKLTSFPESVTSTKFLGIIIDHQLNWSNHIAELVKKLAKANFMIKTLSRQCSRQTICMAYYAQVQSLLQYGLVFWGSATDSIKVFRAQKRVIRSMLSLKHRSSCRQGFKELKILPLPCLYILSVCLFVYDNPSIFKYIEHQHKTRGSNRIAHEYCRLDLTAKGPVQTGRRFFNRLPSHIKEASKRQVFKKTTIQFLQINQFYCLNDFLLDEVC